MHRSIDAVLEAADAWLESYGPVEDYGRGERYCTQLDHGHDEYDRRMDLIVALRRLLDEQEPGR